MTKEEFLIEADNFIYKEVAKNANQILGKNRTAGLSTGLFLKLPIEITLQKVDAPLPRVLKDLATFMPRFSAYVKMGEHTKVYMTFMYNDEKELQALFNNFQYRTVFFAFVYMHELQHIIRKHTTLSYDTMMQRIASTVQEPDHVINIAEDLAINYSLKELIAISECKGSWHEIQMNCQYSKKYHDDKLSDIEILKDLVANAKTPTVSDQGNGYAMVSMDGKDSLQPTSGKAEGPGGDGTGGDKTSTLSDDTDMALADLANSIQDIISSATKGTAAGKLMEDVFTSVKVETGWFKKIKASFKRQVYYMTHDYTTSWSNMNNTYRRIYKAPKKMFHDTKIRIILSVDHSGSMATRDLQKLLYLIESEADKIEQITVLIHDTRIVKEFTIESEYNIAESAEFQEALGVRYVSGGTSHDCVFAHIEGMKIKDPAKVIFLSFSDNQSDIEETVGNYQMMKRLTKYWICAGANNPVNVAGTNIMMV